MGFCTSRLFVLSICILQVVATIERQIFDFLGFMWVPILADFLNIVFVIFGFFGAHQYRPKYVISYCVWSLAWIAWNIFVICFYLNVGILHKDGSALNLGTDSISWWNLHGIGCHPVPNLSNDMLSLEATQRHVPVEGCLLNYEYIEVLHAAVHLFLAALGSTGGAFLTRQFLDDDDTSSNKTISNKLGKGKAVRSTSLYSIEYSPRRPGPERLDQDYGDDSESVEGVQQSNLQAPQLSPRPMTPRRVKRRSVNSRGSTSASASGTLRSSINTHRRYLEGGPGTMRSSLRSSARKNRTIAHQNPVTKLLQQQQQQQQQQQLQQQQQQQQFPPQLPQPDLPPPPLPQQPYLQLPYSLPLQQPQLPLQLPLQQSFSRIGVADSSTSNDSTNRPTDLLLTPDSPTEISPPLPHNWRKTGHVNPLYQQSSTQSLASPEDDEEAYTNRPPSARSSYSNYHGARPLGPLGPLNNYGHAAPQVVVNSYRRSQNPARQSLRNAAFLNSGPPAYRLQGGVDSETVI